MHKKRIHLATPILLFTFLLFTILGFGQEVVKIDFTKTLQKIDGFGASTAWHGALSEKEADVSFGNGENQLGLSLLRLRIDPNGMNNWGSEMNNARKALARGATVFASPWTPPAKMKTNNKLEGGELKPTEYGNYVNFLNSFIDYMANSKAPLVAISLQNESNIKVDYESCDWSKEQMLDFCKNYAHQIKAPVIVPEAFNFDQAYSNAILNDSTANSHVAIIGGHLYGTSPKADPNALTKGKQVWMTEYYVNEEDILTCINMAKQINDCMTSNMNAYVWWWLRQPGCNLITAGGNAIKKKGYVMAQFSKFIRPGYYRTSASFNQYMGVSLTAYTGDKQVLVAINRNTKAKTLQFEFTGDSITYLQKYVTSATKNLQKEGTLEVIDHKFIVELEPQSIVTFVSTNAPCEPTSLTPYLKIGNEPLQQALAINVKASTTVQLAPQPDSLGTWSWSGCIVSTNSKIQTLTPVADCETVATFTNQCGAKSSLNFNITLIPVGIDETGLSKAFCVYPNPVIDGHLSLNIDGLQEQLPLKLKLYSLEGKVVFEDVIDKVVTDFALKLPPAIYLLELSNKHAVLNQKLVVK